MNQSLFRTSVHIPAHETPVHELPVATVWLDSEGFLCLVARDVPRTLENTKELYGLIARLLNGKRTYCLADMSYSGGLDKDTREYIKAEGDKYFTAIAIVTHSMLGRMIGTIISILIPFTVPIQIFGTEDKAREWLQTCRRLRPEAARLKC